MWHYAADEEKISTEQRPTLAYMEATLIQSLARGVKVTIFAHKRNGSIPTNTPLIIPTCGIFTSDKHNCRIPKMKTNQ